MTRWSPAGIWEFSIIAEFEIIIEMKFTTARILKRLDDGQPLVEVARKMKAIEGMQPQINDMERRLGIMQSVEPVLENAIKTLQKVVDVRGMGKK